MRLTFSEFAQLLYPYCGMGNTHADFVTTLTNKIMIRPGSCSGDKSQNPMIDKDKRSRQYFYKGSRPIPRKDAQKIVGDMKKERFETYINSFPDDDVRGIADKLTQKGIARVNMLNVGEKCADIFEVILISGQYEET